MSSRKTPANALLGATSNFSLSDSFGPQPALLVPTQYSVPLQTADLQSSNSTVACPIPPSTSAGSLLAPPRSVDDVPVAGVIPGSSSELESKLLQSASTVAVRGSPISTPSLSHASSVSSLGPSGVAPAGIFLLPSEGQSSSSGPALPPSAARPMFTIGESSAVSLPPTTKSRKIPRYVPPPELYSTPVVGSSNVPSLPPSLSTSVLSPTQDFNIGPKSFDHPSNSVPDFSLGSHQPKQIDMSPYDVPPTQVPQMVFHWFYQAKKPDSTLTYMNSSGEATNKAPRQEIWKPFSLIDSEALEEVYSVDPYTNVLVPTDGGRYDVNIRERTKLSIYWKEAEPTKVRRCSWFYQSNADGRWIPYHEILAAKLEEEYIKGFETGRWGRKLQLGDEDESIMIHSATVIMHFPAASKSTLDDWGQVQLPQDPSTKPRLVHRGLDGLPDIPDGEAPGQVDHLMFIVHGIGSACDMKFRSVIDATEGLRQLLSDMTEKHFASALLSGKASRVEILPVNWHSTLHGEDEGTDARLKPHTLKSVPKMRGFVNDTLLDVLFYTSPVYCQKILDTVTSEINRMYTLFRSRNGGFQGEVSVIGHSLGSVILFDILSNQSTVVNTTSQASVPTKGDVSPPSSEVNPMHFDCSGMTVEQMFAKLGISEEFAVPFSREGIDVEAMMMCTEDDLKEGGLPEDYRARLMQYISGRDGVTSESSKASSLTSDVKFVLGPSGGTGQPSVSYPQLVFRPAAFYALGSPIGMFVSVRGIDNLGPEFSFPTCRRFFNIFHPFDPVAYRVEALVKREYGENLRPMTVPHHKGRKRMHLELKDTVTKIMTSDLKQKFLDSVTAALGTVYNLATGAASSEQAVETIVRDEIVSKSTSASYDNDDTASNPLLLDSVWNGGKRIDYVLQEAPFESFNEYVFALSSHLCYWESEDTCLFILKDVYGSMGIFTDDTLQSGETSSLGAASLDPFPKMSNVVTHPATAVLAPPPTPIGGPMVGPPAPVTDLQATSSFAGTNVTAPFPNPSMKNQAGDRNLCPVPVMPPPGVPPPFSGLSGPTSESSLILATERKPRQFSYPSQYPSGVVGMDPTAPPSVSNLSQLGPPPTSGFTRKH